MYDADFLENVGGLVELYKRNYMDCVRQGLRPDDAVEQARIFREVENLTSEGVHRLNVFKRYGGNLEEVLEDD